MYSPVMWVAATNGPCAIALLSKQRRLINKMLNTLKLDVNSLEKMLILIYLLS
jgi:hypothetical protein